MTDIHQFEDDLYSAGQPSQEQLAQLAARGVRTVINLRGTEEAVAFDEGAEAQRLGLHYVSLPIAGAEQLQRHTIEVFATALEHARRNGPVLIHCASGNRVGAAIALQCGWIEGRKAHEALEAGRSAGLAGLEPVVANLLGPTQATS